MEDLKDVGADIDCILADTTLSDADKIAFSYGLINTLSVPQKPSFLLWKTAFETSENKNVEEIRKGMAFLMEALPEFKTSNFLEIHNLMRQISSYDRKKNKKTFSEEDKNTIKAALRLQLIKLS